MREGASALVCDALLASRIFRVAAIYGVVVLLPMYLLDVPDPHKLTQVGFVGLALVFQAMFWIIANAPVKFRALMPLAVAEKAVFGLPAIAFFALGRTDAVTAGFGAADLLLGLLFLWVWLGVRRVAA